MGTSIFLSVIAGGAIGTYYRRSRGGPIERVVPTLSLFLRSIPIYWLGIMLLSVFAFWLRWLPGSGMHSLGFRGRRVLKTLLILGFFATFIATVFLRFSSWLE